MERIVRNLKTEISQLFWDISFMNAKDYIGADLGNLEGKGTGDGIEEMEEVVAFQAILRI
jgi:hypothetical protein